MTPVQSIDLVLLDILKLAPSWERKLGPQTAEVIAGVCMSIVIAYCKDSQRMEREKFLALCGSTWDVCGFEPSGSMH